MSALRQTFQTALTMLTNTNADLTQQKAHIEQEKAFSYLICFQFDLVDVTLCYLGHVGEQGDFGGAGSSRE